MTKIFLFIIFGVALLCGVSYLLWEKSFAVPTLPEQIACTQEAMLCPDGSYVGRTGPQCEFSRCPDNVWETFIDEKQGISFQYPEQLTTTYIRAFDWPPKINVINEPFSCMEGGSEVVSRGATQKRTINNQVYCVTEIMGAAAGTAYTQYTYTFPKNDRVLIFTFTLKSVECGNYDDPQKTLCENERGAFNVDSIVDRMASSLEIRN